MFSEIYDLLYETVAIGLSEFMFERRMVKSAKAIKLQDKEASAMVRAVVV